MPQRFKTVSLKAFNLPCRLKTTFGNEASKKTTSLLKTRNQGLLKTENIQQVVQKPNILLNVSDVEQIVNKGNEYGLSTESRDNVAEPDHSQDSPEDEDTGDKNKLDESSKKTAVGPVDNSTSDKSPDVHVEDTRSQLIGDKHEKKKQVQDPSVPKQVKSGDTSNRSSPTRQLVVHLERIDISSFTPIIKKGDVTTSIEQNRYIDVSDLLAKKQKVEACRGPDENQTTVGHSTSGEEEQDSTFAASYLTADTSHSNEDQGTEIRKTVQQASSSSNNLAIIPSGRTARTKVKTRLSKVPRKFKVKMRKTFVGSSSIKEKVPKIAKKSCAVMRKQSFYNEQSLFCEICGLKFRCFKRYWNHVHTVHADHTFTCVACDRNTFKKSESVLNHSKLKHKGLDNKCLEDEGEPLFYCEVCGLGFRHIESRANHINGVHTDGYIRCPYCIRSFSSLDNLLCHIKVHDQGKKALYRCSMCYKKLYFLHMYVHHIQSHQNTVSLKVLKCEICFLKITGISMYVRHLEQHLYNNPQYFCFICKNVFVSNKKLELHMKYLHKEHFATHACILHLTSPKTPEKDVSHCYWCGKIVSSHYIKVHLRRHSKFTSFATRKSIICKICLKDVPSFTYRKHISAHLFEMKKTNELDSSDRNNAEEKDQMEKLSALSKSQETIIKAVSASTAPKTVVSTKKVIVPPNLKKTDKQAGSTKNDAASGWKKSDETSELKKADKSSVAIKSDKTSFVEKADSTSHVKKTENTSVVMEADKISDEEKADEASPLRKAGESSDVNKNDTPSVAQKSSETSDLNKTEKKLDLEEPKKTSDETSLKNVDTKTNSEIIDLTEDLEKNDKKTDSKKFDVETDSKKIAGKQSEIVEITSDPITVGKSSDLKKPSKMEIGEASDLKKPGKMIDTKKTSIDSDSKKSGEIFDSNKSDNKETPENRDKQQKNRKKSRFSSTAPLQIEPQRTPIQKLPKGPKNRTDPFTSRFEPPRMDGPPGVDMDGPPGVDVFPELQRPVPPGVTMSPFNYMGSVNDNPAKNVGPVVPFNPMGSVGRPMGPMSNVGQMGPFNPVNPVDSSTMGPFNTMGSVGPMSQGMDMTMYAQQNPGMPYYQQFGNQFQQMQGGVEPYFNQGMNFMDSGQYYGDPSMGGYQQFTQYMSQWSGSQMVHSGDVVKTPKLFSKNATACSGCEKEFGTSKVLAVHELFCIKLVEQLSKQKLHECPVCAQMFTSLANIKQHMFQSHAQIFKEFNLISGKSATKVGKDECKSCKQFFKSKEELAAHELTHEFLASLKSDLEKVDVSNTLLGKNAAANAKKEDAKKIRPPSNIRKSRFDQKTPEHVKISSQAAKSAPSSSATRQKSAGQNKIEVLNANNKIDDLEQKLRETLKKTEEMEKARSLEDLRSPSFKMKLEQQKKKLKINLLYYQKQKLEQEKQARSIAVQKADEELKRIQKELLESQKASVETIDLTQTGNFRKRSRSPYAKRSGTRPDYRRKSRSKSRDRKYRELERSPDVRRRSRSTSRDRQYPKSREENPEARRSNLRDPRNIRREQSPNKRERVRSPISPRARGRRSPSPERYGRNLPAENIPQRMSPGRSRDMSMIRPRSNSRERLELRPEASINVTFDKPRTLNIKPGEEMRVYKCNKCATLFTNYRDYIRHNDMHEDEEDDEENYLTQLNMSAPAKTTSLSYSSRSQTHTSYPVDGTTLEKNNPVVFRDYFSRSADTDLPVEKERNLLSSTSRWHSAEPKIGINEGDRFRASVAESSFLSRRRDVSPYRPQRPTENIFPIQDMSKTSPLVTAYTHLQKQQQQQQQYTPSRIVRVKCRVCSQEFPSQEYLDYHACPGPF